MKKIGEVSSFFGWRATSGLLNRCLGVSELNSRDAMGRLGVLSRFDNRIRWVYHRRKAQRWEVKYAKVQM
jgi:hypothetical protein